MSAIKSFFKKIPLLKQCLENHENLEDIKDSLARLLRTQESMRHTLIAEYLDKHLKQNPKYQNPLKLNQYEYKVFSQNGEDGIIEEIFNRIGTESEFFVELGAAHGLENCTTALLLKEWRGVWFEPNMAYRDGIMKRFGDLISAKKLIYKSDGVTPDNAETLFERCLVPEAFDLLVVDIHGNDYWVWKAIERFQPRVVVIEYNGRFRPSTKWVMKYNPSHRWDYTSYMGASLKSLELLGKSKGYSLVGCDFRGVNAFFVREDQAKGKFLEPFTSENHYESPKHNLVDSSAYRNLHWPGFGRFEQI